MQFLCCVELTLMNIALNVAYSCAAFSGCNTSPVHGVQFYTAGQRIDPNSNSTFIWRMKSSDTNAETLSVMKYTNWHRGQPDFLGGRQSCMEIWSGHSYTWDDGSCHVAYCSVCEVDI